jgi:hypothetical protein
MSTRRLAALSFSAALFALAPRAIAQQAAQPAQPAQPTPTLDPVAREAQQLFMDGRDAVKRGELPLALEKFQRSYELHPTQGTLLNLGAVNEQLGKLVKALEHFELAKKQLAESDDRYPVARDGAARVRPRIPTLRIEYAAGSPVQMSVRLDGAPVAASSIGAELPLDPGTYRVITSAPGREEKSYEVALKEAAHLTLTVEAGNKLATALAAPPPSGRPTATQAFGIAAGGIGFAGIVIGAVTGVGAITAKSDAAKLCPDPKACTGAGLEAAGKSRALADVSTASFVIGLAGVAAGVTLVLVGREKPAAPSAALAPLVLPGGGGIGAHGRF